MKYNCIIFDCDGVLVDSEAISTKVLIEMAKNVGVSIQKEEVADYFAGKSLQSLFTIIGQQTKQPLPKNFEQLFRQKTFDLFKKELKAVDGVHELIDALDLPFCVASNGPLHKIEHNLNITGLLHKFNGHLFSAYDIGKWKPDPTLFTHAASEMGFAPQQCLVIEDSLVGVQAAVSGGFDVYAYTKHGNDTTLKAAGATLTFNKMQQLTKRLTKATV